MHLVSGRPRPSGRVIQHAMTWDDVLFLGHGPCMWAEWGLAVTRWPQRRLKWTCV